MSISAALKLMAVGDLILDAPEPRSFFELARGALNEAAVLVGHVEVPHTRRGRESTSDVPASPSNPDNLAAVKRRAGFHVATRAGNHLFDAGPDGIEDTIATLRRLGIATTGAGMCLEEHTGRQVVTRSPRRPAQGSFAFRIAAHFETSTVSLDHTNGRAEQHRERKDHRRHYLEIQSTEYTKWRSSKEADQCVPGSPIDGHSKNGMSRIKALRITCSCSPIDVNPGNFQLMFPIHPNFCLMKGAGLCPNRRGLSPVGIFVPNSADTIGEHHADAKIPLHRYVYT
jgi:hypothetical protein